MNFEFLKDRYDFELARKDDLTYRAGRTLPAGLCRRFAGELRLDQEEPHRIIEAADTSAMSNDRRATYLHRARQSLLAVLILTFVTGFVYVLAKVI